jgi:hypothetical protein
VKHGFLSGVLLILIGAAVMVIAREYRSGSPLLMEPCDDGACKELPKASNTANYRMLIK